MLIIQGGFSWGAVQQSAVRSWVQLQIEYKAGRAVFCVEPDLRAVRFYLLERRKSWSWHFGGRLPPKEYWEIDHVCNESRSLDAAAG